MPCPKHAIMDVRCAGKAKMNKYIVCLAISRKHNGRCIAGIEVAQGERVGWIRLVSTREHEEVLEGECRYRDGSNPRLLDVIDVPLIEHRPRRYQQENWTFNQDYYWERVNRMTWDDLPMLADPELPLWSNGSSTLNGINDRIHLSSTQDIGNSLRLIRVDRITLSVFAFGEAFGNPQRRVKGTFRYAGDEYRFTVTDPNYERKYLALENGDYLIGESFVTVSLGEPHKDGYCYKLIAAIMERDGGPNQ